LVFWTAKFSLTYLIDSSSWSEAAQKLTALLLLLPIVYIMASTFSDCERCRLVIFSFRIDRSKYAWGCCYLAMAVFLFSCVASLLLIWCYWCLSRNIRDLSDASLPIVALGIIPFLLIVRIVIGGYAGMLEGASFYPRKRFYLKISRQLSWYRQEYFRQEKKFETLRQKSKLVGDATHLPKPYEQRKMLRDEIDQCLTETDKAELRLKQRPELLEEFRTERRLGLEHMEDVASCFEDAADIARVHAILLLRTAPGG
jgi:hypothetical protein